MYGDDQIDVSLESERSGAVAQDFGEAIPKHTIATRLAVYDHTGTILVAKHATIPKRLIIK